MNIDQSNFDMWLKNDVTKVLLDMCEQSIEDAEDEILLNATFTSEFFCREAFYKGGIKALIDHVRHFDLELIKQHLESKEEVENGTISE